MTVIITGVSTVLTVGWNEGRLAPPIASTGHPAQHAVG